MSWTCAARDLAYTDPVPAETKGNLLDLYLPSESSGEPRPLLIWSSGSAWMKDNGKVNAELLADVFAPQGYAVAGVSVRSSGQVQFPGQLHDIRKAIRWLRSHADEYWLDPDRFAIAGSSSGGWVAAIAATTSSIARLDGESDVAGVSSAVQAAVPFFAPTDFSAMDTQTVEQQATYDLDYLPVILHDDAGSPESLLVGGPVQDRPDAAVAASPMSYVDGSEPPLLVLHGTADPLLPPGQSRALFDALVSAGSPAELRLVDGAGHRVADEFAGAPGLPGTSVLGQPGGPEWDDVVAFVDSALGLS